MGNLRIKCDSCGYEITILKGELSDCYCCMLCGGQMLVQHFKPKIETDSQDNLIDKLMISAIKKEIEVYGHKRTYEILERISDPKIRARHRELFIIAGGNISEKSIFIETNGKLYLKG